MTEQKGTKAAGPEALAASLETLARHYRALARLSQRQRRLIEISDTAGLMRVLAAREAVLERLRAIQPGVERAVAALRPASGAMPPQVRERIRSLLDEIGQTLGRVIKADAEDSQRLVIRRSVVAERLDEQRQAEQAARAYRPKAQVPAGGRLDLKDQTP